MQDIKPEDLPLDIEILRAYGGLIVFFACFWGLLKIRGQIYYTVFVYAQSEIRDKLLTSFYELQHSVKV